MIHGLQRLGWRKVEVSFHSAFWPFFAHNNIHVRASNCKFFLIHDVALMYLLILGSHDSQQVKNEWFHNAGAGVVAHVADTIKQQEKQHDSLSTYIAASL